jgi:hypothetical protein
MASKSYSWSLVAPVTSTSATAIPVGGSTVVPVDFSCIEDIDSSLSVISDANEILAQSVVRRLTTERGSLFYDLNYGFDVRGFFNAALSASEAATLERAIADECEKDERIVSATAQVRFSSATREMVIKLELESVYGTTPLTLTVDRVSVTILRGYDA